MDEDEFEKSERKTEIEIFIQQKIKKKPGNYTESFQLKDFT